MVPKTSIWRPSPPPEEDWGDQEEWAVSGIVSEELDSLGLKRYEVKWDDWHREDGTNTTWVYGMPDAQNIVDKWDKDQLANRSECAKQSLEVKISSTDILWHEVDTFEVAQSREEKRREGRRKGIEKYKHWDSVPSVPDDNNAIDIDVDNRTALHPHNTSRVNLVSQPSRISTSAQPSPSRESIPRRSRLSHNRRIITPEPEGNILVATKPVIYPRRVLLQKKWTEATQGKASSLTIVNDINQQDIPPLMTEFIYLEQHYMRAPDVPDISENVDIFITCNCQDSCNAAQSCGCQSPSDLVDDYGDKIFAYDRDRRFLFNLPPGVEAIECNQHCSCSEMCSNRVAQRPRDVPIEVFRTANRGWGARATIDILKGKVLGVYTGKLIRREHAEQLTGDHKSYVFDLDVRENADEEHHDDPKYSVDAYASGNWTRFVNHSCAPNTRVYPVVWDTIPDMNQPYLAFVTTEDIPARTELTIDYDPREGANHQKGKRKRETPVGATICMCESRNCRGWVRV